MRLRARVAAPIDTVWTALTDPAALRVWFAEHVDVSLPDRYQFWGKYTIEGTEPRQRLRHAADHTLRFDWLGTTVEISLTEQAGHTSVVVEQTGLPDWSEMLAQDGPLALMHTFWALATANLADYAEGRPITGRADYTGTDLHAQVEIAASPADVFDSLVDEDKFAQWFGARMQMEHFVGGRWAMGGFDADPEPAKVLDLDPGRKLAIGWQDGLVNSWELEGSAGHTRLTFVQSGFTSDGTPGHGPWSGWLAGLADLRRFHEIPDWRPLWSDVHVEGMPDAALTYGKQEA